MSKLYIKLFIAFGFFFSLNQAVAQLTVDNTLTPQQLVEEVLLGDGVEVSNIQFAGNASVQFGAFNSENANVGIPYGVIMASGDIQNAIGPNTQTGITTSLGGPGDPDLTEIAGIQTNDAAVLEFDFVPVGDTVKFNYVFASDEYIEYANSSINDAFAFILSGVSVPLAPVNIATLPGTNTPVTLNTVNDTQNPQYYIDNGDSGPAPAPFSTDPYYIEYDGLTVVLTAQYPVQCGETYHIKIVIADGSDSILDSGVFLEGGSFTSPEVINVALGTTLGNDSTIYENCGVTDLIFSRASGGEDDWVQIGYGGTALFDIDINQLPDSLFFPEGVNELVYPLEAFGDGIMEGLETLIISVTNFVPCSNEYVETDFTLYIEDELTGGIVEDDFTIATCNEEIELHSELFGGKPDFQFEWTDGNGNLLGSGADLTYVLNEETSFYLNVLDECNNSFDDSVTVSPSELPSISDLPFTVEVTCVDTSFFEPTVEGGIGEYNYSWIINGIEEGSDSTFVYHTLDTTLVTFVVEDECFSTDTAEVLIEFIPSPVSIEIGDDVDASCIDQTVLNADIDGGVLPYTYQWYIDTTFHSNIAQVTIQSYETIQVSLTLTETCGNSDSDTMTINVPDNPIDITTVNDTLICEGTPAFLSAMAEGGEGGFQYSWDPVDIHQRSIEVYPDEPTIYEVTAVDICDDSVSAFVEVDIDFIQAIIDYEYISGYDISFFGETEPECDNCQYEWDFGDGESTLQENPYHSFDGVIDYYTELTVTTEIGCTSSATVKIDAPVSLYVPNAFTPNGDGVNDYFRVFAEGVVEYEIMIFNRWGDVVFKSQDPTENWLGEDNNGDYYSKDGVYSYFIKYEDVDGVEKSKTGNITIVR